MSRRYEAPAWARAWFALTVRERWLLAAVLAVWLVGLLARHRHQRLEQPERFDPIGAYGRAEPSAAPPGGERS